ncbi:MAG: hypothetical protein A3F74_08745 [Betaproteobacteria bacterium RIFCSPLOWO2_12_FULL_62_58]|nr:MAG: hypothetical protein A3F74_08745 [Betaproteobacteria bacterium RIFCSPLOWO2_12_FULL_62_58]
MHEKSPRPKPTSELLISQGADPIDSTAEEFRDRIKADLVKWTATIATAGVRLERYCVERDRNQHRLSFPCKRESIGCIIARGYAVWVPAPRLKHSRAGFAGTTFSCALDRDSVDCKQALAKSRE